MSLFNFFFEQSSDSLFAILLKLIFIPVFIGLVAFVITTGWTERTRRLKYSKLGVVVIESLIEEVTIGLSIMRNALIAISNERVPDFHSGLPTQSWSGMLTINDDVLLEIIETSEDRDVAGRYPLRACRSHCKNYFEKICPGYNNLIKRLANSPALGDDFEWLSTSLTSQDPDVNWITATENVLLMLQDGRTALDENSNRRFPK